MMKPHENSSTDWALVRQDFPILNEVANGHPLAFLDSAASSQMPKAVLERIVAYQQHEHANIHRGVHVLSQRATDAYEDARRVVAGHIGAAEREVVFVRGATEAINLVAHGFGRKFLKEGDEIVLTVMEHHANIVPWQMLREEKGVVLKVVPMTDEGEIELEAFEAAFTDRTRFASVIHVSNSLGTVNPVKEMAEIAHRHDVPILIDGCQAAPHMAIDVRDLGADFYVFSGHKMCAPTGSGVLYGRADLLKRMNPFMGGGDMILSVSFEKTIYNEIPYKFEAGTPAIMPVIGLAAAIRYLRSLGLENIAAREAELTRYAISKLESLDGVRVFGPKGERAPVVSFAIGDVHPHDVGTILDSRGVAIRAGHHCTQPLMKRLGVSATARASFAFYNNESDVDALVGAVGAVQEIFG